MIYCGLKESELEFAAYESVAKDKKFVYYHTGNRYQIPETVNAPDLDSASIAVATSVRTI